MSTWKTKKGKGWEEKIKVVLRKYIVVKESDQNWHSIVLSGEVWY